MIPNRRTMTNIWKTNINPELAGIPEYFLSIFVDRGIYNNFYSHLQPLTTYSIDFSSVNLIKKSGVSQFAPRVIQCSRTGFLHIFWLKQVLQEALNEADKIIVFFSVKNCKILQPTHCKTRLDSGLFSLAKFHILLKIPFSL